MNGVRPHHVTRVAVPESTRRALYRAEVRLGGRAQLLAALHVGANIVWDALAPMGRMQPAVLERVQNGLRAIGEEP